MIRFAAWLYLNLVPFSVYGCLLAAAGYYYDQKRTPASRLIMALLVAGLLASASISAAQVYDMCNDPAWRDTWWWYAWGCYLH